MKVTLVTHSMGGLQAARALTQLHGCERVLGVVYNMQPATGSSTLPTCVVAMKRSHRSCWDEMPVK